MIAAIGQNENNQFSTNKQQIQVLFSSELMHFGSGVWVCRGWGSGPSMVQSHPMTLSSNRRGRTLSWPPRAWLGTLIGWKVHVSENRRKNYQAEMFPLWITAISQHAHCVGAEMMAVITMLVCRSNLWPTSCEKKTFVEKATKINRCRCRDI